jgi:hypothetical protein
MIRLLQAFILILSQTIFEIVTSFPQSTFIRGPPLNNKQKQGGGGAENGIRQISKEECQYRINEWYREGSAASGPLAIERLEMLMQLDKLSQVIPGKYPQRVELLSFGLISDGKIDCAVGIVWQKLTLPNEMKIISLYDKSSNLDTQSEMLCFIDDMCRENAIIPDYSSLEQYDIFQESMSRIPSRRNKTKLDPLTLRRNELRNQYSDLNKAGSVCLDMVKIPSTGSEDILSIDLGHYWYKSSLSHDDLEIAFYFRQKKGRIAEYEVRFNRPEAGTLYGSGTVGCPLVIPIDHPDQAIPSIPQHTPEELASLAEALRNKIIRPEM